ncbi:MAG: serine O-acetyltransferase EpsC [Eubacteriales bacterium]
MDNELREHIQGIVDEITQNYITADVFLQKKENKLPKRSEIIKILNELRSVMFPSYFGSEHVDCMTATYFVGEKMSSLYESLSEQIELALSYSEEFANEEKSKIAKEKTVEILKKMPEIQRKLLTDVQAAFDGDPAAGSKEQIIFSYPGLYAIFVYRVAHELYIRKIPLIPRIMTEYAHSKTGIDINAGAKIGEHFFIDHGTGVVVGETTTIGDNVKLYQGVTLGALSTRGGQSLVDIKRHPTIEDDVTIYSGASILGGNTIVGKGSVIGGNSFITESIPQNARVSTQFQELNIDAKK